jgi:hypothetical protein
MTMGLRLAYIALLALLWTGVAAAVDLDDVIGMLEAGVDEEAIFRLIDSEDAVFVVVPEDLIDLKEAGASDDLIEEILDRSVDHPRSVRTVRPVYDAGLHYTIGVVYDPFDYYFVGWPYYYAYVTPFPFSWSWWYYGGPVHHHWCSSWNWRVHYYDQHWGSRSIWNHGIRNRVNHVPRYDLTEKDLRHYAERSRPEIRPARAGAGDRMIRDRSGRVRRSDLDRFTREERRSDVRRQGWGRPDARQRETRRSQDADRSRSSWGSERPKRGDSGKSSVSPSRSESRPSRGSPPAAPRRSGSGSSSKPAERSERPRR